MPSRTRQQTGRRLVIVESPAKAKTIAGYLGDGFEVEASVGHIRDLPQPSELPADKKHGTLGKFAVDVEDGFAPYYVVNPDKKKKVAELRKLLKGSDELYLATDEDREGEAIAWHLLQVLKPTVPVHRMVFHEITRDAIRRALDRTRELDDKLVDAQETRRILDRLYGYEVSPVLWRKVRAGLSAGRVQSVATRLVVQRERERMAFRAADYWDVEGTFAPRPDAPADAGESFPARLVALEGRRIATGRDFDDAGHLKSDDVAHLDGAAAESLVARLTGDDAPGFAVRSLETKPYTRRPAAPFTTSTLQQEASRKLHFSARQTMRTAQGLYENGYITYMRTDSTVLSEQALHASRTQAAELYGPEYVPDRPRIYHSKSKNAQEAHEAVRPAGDHFRTPAQVAGELHGDQYRLYELIWVRTVASQMADAHGSTATVRLGTVPAAAGAPAVPDAEFSASGTVITFRGFMAAYEEGRDEDRHVPAGRGAAERRQVRLPQLAEGQALEAAGLEAAGHRTSPPPRYTEASLVKTMEELGIGRPSTYAATLSTIVDRGYVTRRGSALVPSWLAFSVVRLLEEHFSRLVDYDFTAAMEEDLDRIARGDEARNDYLERFYFGDPDDGGEHPADGLEGLKRIVEDLGDIDAREINSVHVAPGITLRVGRYGPYLEAPGEKPDDPPRRASVPDDLAPDELTEDRARELLAAAAQDGRVLGTDPATGHEIVARNGRFGPYVTEVLPEPEETAAKDSAAKGSAAKTTAKGSAAKGSAAKGAATKASAKRGARRTGPKPRTASLFKSMTLEGVTLDDALTLLSLPRTVGTDPESGEPITAQNGRYGPYLKKGTDSRSLTDEQQLLTITLDEALAIFAQPKRRGRGAAKPPLAELGEDPVSGGAVVVKDGRFGPYVTDGTTNVTLPKGQEPSDVTHDQAVELLAEKRAKGPAKRTRRATGGAKKTTRKTSAKTSGTKTSAKASGTTKKAAPRRRTSASAKRSAPSE